MTRRKKRAWFAQVRANRTRWNARPWPDHAMLFRTCAALLVIFTVLAFAQTQDEPKQVLRDARQRVLDTVERLPKYVCTETITRYRYAPDADQNGVHGKPQRHSCDDVVAEVHSAQWKQHLTSSDRLRFDVAVNRDPSAVDGEMYSWVGAGRFSSRDVFEIVPDGAMSTGSFSSMLASIFSGPATRFSYNGDTIAGERMLCEFGFRVPKDQSEYFYVFGRDRSSQARMAYNGTLLIDAESHDLVRLVVRSGTLPEESGACELTRTVDYGRTRLHGADFFLPSSTRVSLIHTDETVAENVITYSSCREFEGESTVRYERVPETAPAAPRVTEPAQKLALPPGLPFTLVFTEGIDPAVAAAGDAIQAKLKTPIRTRSKIVVPAGTPVMGRIVSIRRYYPQPASRTREGRKDSSQQPSLVLGVKLESVEIGGVAQPLKATLDVGLQRFVRITGSLSGRVDLGPLDRLEDSGTAVFEFWDANAGRPIESGLESNWRTLEP